VTTTAASNAERIKQMTINLKLITFILLQKEEETNRKISKLYATNATKEKRIDEENIPQGLKPAIFLWHLWHG
jgi:hypothetical protein